MLSARRTLEQVNMGISHAFEHVRGSGKAFYLAFRPNGKPPTQTVKNDGHAVHPDRLLLVKSDSFAMNFYTRIHTRSQDFLAWEETAQAGPSVAKAFQVKKALSRAFYSLM